MSRDRLVDTSRPVNGRLSEGALVEASLRARLFGIPLLRIDAAVVLTPLSGAGSFSAVSAGDGLAEAVLSISEGADVLAQVRRPPRR